MVNKNQTARSNKKVIAGRYKVMREIVGGMGIVYLCSDLAHNKHPVVLKTYHSRYAGDVNVRAQFLREAAIWVELGWHPNIVQALRAVYDRTERTIYLVIEMVPPIPGIDNPTLSALLGNEKKIEFDRALCILLNIVRGMKYATARIPGLIHCDLKPENVFIRADGRACVSDFGLVSTPNDIHESLSMSAPRYINNNSRPVGTPYYMSPERWRNRKVSISSDIYSLGCIFLEMLTAEPTVQGESIKDLIESHIRGDALNRARKTNYPKIVGMFLSRCLEPNPRYRYQTWEEVELCVNRMYEVLLAQSAPNDIVLFDVSQKAQVALGETWFSIGEAYLDINEFWAALACFEKSKSIAKAQNYLSLAAQSEASIGSTYFKLGQSDRAIAHYRKAASLKERFGGNESISWENGLQDGFSLTHWIT